MNINWVHREGLETVHEGVSYPCDCCDYKAITKGDCKKHVKSIHEGVHYSCHKCEYKATTLGTNCMH